VEGSPSDLGLAVPVAQGAPPVKKKLSPGPESQPSVDESQLAQAEPVAPELVSKIETIIANGIRLAQKESKGKAGSQNCAVSMMAVDLATGQVLVRRMEGLPMIPASNMKLLTAAAALAGMGPDGEFQTRFEAVGEIRDGILEGDLVVRAGGDPLYSVEGDGSLDPWLAPLAKSLKAAGIERVAGALVLDEGDWLTPGPAPEWPAPSDHWQMYCALAGGFTANAGSFRATVTPQPKRGRVDVTLRPKSHGLKRRGSVAIGKRNAVNVGANKNGVTVKGTIPGSSAPLVSEFSAPDPVELFGHATVGWLAAHQVAVEGGFVRARGWEPKGEVVHTIRTPITGVLEPILKDSHNSVADQLFLALGHKAEGAGTRQAAAKAVRSALDQIGVPDDGLVQVDGSGLSKANRTNAMQLVALVAAVLQTGGAMADAFLDALPVSAESGSLKKRMSGTPAAGRIRAKTGWVNGASSLSGVANTREGRTLVFSILVSYPRVSGLNTKAWKPMQDEICNALVEWMPGAGSRSPSKDQ
jgi:D-alanyl-D-alanine carboxypeptidase/D-alanyl-D-alanine-endopeptidase (penicillin-binding protein 4)